MWLREPSVGLTGRGISQSLLCPKTRANEELGSLLDGIQWERKILSAGRQDWGGTAAFGTQTHAPSSLQQQPLPAVPRAGAGQRGILLQGTETTRLSHARAESNRYSLLARLFTPVAAAECRGAGAAPSSSQQRPPLGLLLAKSL